MVAKVKQRIVLDLPPHVHAGLRQAAERTFRSMSAAAIVAICEKYKINPVPPEDRQPDTAPVSGS